MCNGSMQQARPLQPYGREQTKSRELHTRMVPDKIGRLTSVNPYILAAELEKRRDILEAEAK